MGRRPRRGTPDETRARLVAVAADVMNRVGYFGTDSNALARAAGYAPAIFYRHFPDKRAILLAAYARWVATEWEEIGTILRADAATPDPGPRAARIAARLVPWIVAHHRRWYGLRASVLALAVTDPVVRRTYLAQRRGQLDLLRDLRGGRPAADARETDAVLLFTFERTCDALAGGAAVPLGLRPARLEALLVRLLDRVSRRRPRPPTTALRGQGCAAACQGNCLALEAEARGGGPDTAEGREWPGERPPAEEAAARRRPRLFADGNLRRALVVIGRVDRGPRAGGRQRAWHPGDDPLEQRPHRVGARAGHTAAGPFGGSWPDRVRRAAVGRATVRSSPRIRRTGGPRVGRPLLGGGDLRSCPDRACEQDQER
jgi:AcrR family transcriptional regulator